MSFLRPRRSQARSCQGTPFLTSCDRELSKLFAGKVHGLRKLMRKKRFCDNRKFSYFAKDNKICNTFNMFLDPLFITYGLVVCIVILVGWIIRLEIRIKRLLVGKNSKSLEDSILAGHANLEKLNEFQKEALTHFTNVEKRLNRSIQAVETIRFNPFKGTGEGGNQSFSTAFLNETGSGVVISSLYSRDRVSIFSKPLEKFGSGFELTDEEKEVINNSKNFLR